MRWKDHHDRMIGVWLAVDTIPAWPVDSRAQQVLRTFLADRMTDPTAVLEGDEVDFRGADLSGLDLTEAYLLGARLDGVGLVGTDLFRATLHGASVVGADLTWASLRKVEGTQCDLRGA